MRQGSLSLSFLRGGRYDTWTHGFFDLRKRSIPVPTVSQIVTLRSNYLFKGIPENGYLFFRTFLGNYFWGFSRRWRPPPPTPPPPKEDGKRGHYCGGTWWEGRLYRGNVVFSLKDEGINTCLVVSVHPTENLSVCTLFTQSACKYYLLMTYNSKGTCLSMIIVLLN